MNDDDPARELLECVRRPDYRPLTQAQLLHRLHVPRERRARLRRRIRELLEQGTLVEERGGRLAAP
ncbi:MAG TPA: hypothetical protein VJS92_17405, partial [Candidatus Polarisedimenticolaceae bacterium]|nr:hypothetical protein [Candidatus Polarisedimenticolaceae bacterium]